MVSENNLPLSLEKGGTGKTTAVDAANTLINGLGVGTAPPKDEDAFISQWAGGAAAGKNTYYRRPVSKLWEYIKGKLKNDSMMIPDTGWVNGISLKIIGNTIHLRRIGGLVMIRYIYTPMMGSYLDFNVSGGMGEPDRVDIIDFSKNAILNECFGSGLLEGPHCIGDSLYAEAREESKTIKISLYMKNFALSTAMGVNAKRTAFCLCIPTIDSFPKNCATNLGGTALNDYLI